MSGRVPRLHWLDATRGVAVVAMVIYHACWNLAHFGYLFPSSMAGVVGVWSARLIASTFLGLAGISLALAHGERFRADAFWKRFAMIAAAAAGVSLVTLVAMPDLPIYFGILHCIAASSLLAMLMLRWPLWLVAPIGLALVLLPLAEIRSDAIGPLWLWTGLVPDVPAMADYVPMIPFSGVMLLGLAIGHGLRQRAEGTINRGTDPSQARFPVRWLVMLGRHSLLIYLAHQPMLYGATFLAASLLPPTPQFDNIGFMTNCAADCTQTLGDAPHCERLCRCAVETLLKTPDFARISTMKNSTELYQVITRASKACAANIR
jgi:uncharacterized membrane protein